MSRTTDSTYASDGRGGYKIAFQMLSPWVGTHVVGEGLEIEFFVYVLKECRLIKIFLIYSSESQKFPEKS